MPRVFTKIPPVCTKTAHRPCCKQPSLSQEETGIPEKIGQADILSWQQLHLPKYIHSNKYIWQTNTYTQTNTAYKLYKHNPESAGCFPINPYTLLCHIQHWQNICRCYGISPLLLGTWQHGSIRIPHLQSQLCAIYYCGYHLLCPWGFTYLALPRQNNPYSYMLVLTALRRAAT